MAKRPVLLTMEHIVVFKSCKWSGYKGKGPLAAPVQGSLPPDTCIFTAWEGISFKKPHSLGAANWSLETFMRSPYLWELILQGQKNSQSWSPCFYFKAKIFLQKFCILYLLTHFTFQAADLVWYFNFLSISVTWKQSRRVSLLFPVYLSNMCF